MDRTARQLLYLFALVLLALAWPAHATIEPPDHIYYGTATLYGNPVPAGAVVEARTNPEGVLLRRYTVGSNSFLGSYYKLAIPLDTIDPRKPGRARVGDPIRIFVNGLLAAEVSVGIDPDAGVTGVGSTTRLDLDPQNAGSGPAISIAGTSVVEGDSGITSATLSVTLNAVADQEIGILWETRDGTATGGPACGPGVDFVQRIARTLTIPVGAQQGSIDIQVCGDTEVELDEEFSVVLLSTVDNYGVFTTDSTATVMIVDDDNVPSLRVADIRVARPAAGTTTARFAAILSRTHDHDVSFHWATQNGTAQAGPDYVANSGTVTIPTGETHANLDVVVQATPAAQPDETFRIVLSNPVSLALQQTPATATLVDPRYDPAVQEVDATTGQDVPDLSQPTAIALSPDGLYAYAASGSKNAVLRFERDAATGMLSDPVSYKTSTAGFNLAKLTGLQDLKLSADGNFVYVAAMDDNAITVFARNATDGSLAFVESVAQGAAVQGMKKPFRLALSPDGAQVYVLAQESSAVTSFDRDPGTGQLTFARSINQSAPNLVKLVAPGGIVVSPDGAQVYVTARLGNALLAFDRNTDTTSEDFGALAWRATFAGGPGGITTGLKGAFGIALSPDGRQIYVTAEADNAVSLFDRAIDGSLSLRGVIQRGAPGVHGLGGAQGIVVAPNGKEVFVTGNADDSLSVFDRTTAGAQAGALAIHRTVFKGDNGLVHLSQPGAMAASMDDRFVYVAASGGDSAIVVYRRLSINDLFSDSFEALVVQ